MAELPSEGSPASMDDRIGALLDEPVSEVTAPEGPDDAAPDGDETEASPDVIEEEVDGVVLRGNKEAVERLKSERASKQDYTVKTQEAANLRKAAEDRIQFAEAREQIMSEVMQDVSALNAKRERLQQLSAVDLGQLYNADPAQMFSVQRQIDTLKSEIADAERAVHGKVQNTKAMIEQHRNKQWELAVEGAKQKLGNVSAEDDAAMLRQVQLLGFEQDELKGRFADPRFLQLVWKAAKLDAIQSGKPQALAAVSKAPPVVKPGTTGTSQFSQKMNFHKAMKSAKSDSQKAELIGAKLLNRFGI